MSLRVFHPGPFVAGHELVLDDDESHYIARVRRAKAGALLEVLDGTRARWSAEAVEVRPRETRVRLVAPVATPTPPLRALELLLGVPDVRATSEILATCVELGVSRIVPLTTTYAQAMTPNAARIERVLRAAQRQSGRPDAPVVAATQSFEQVVAEPTGLAKVIAWEAHRDRPPVVPPSGSGVRVLVGPEGGLTQHEAELAISHGYVPMGLGPWTLRSTTAVVVALARLSARYGE